MSTKTSMNHDFDTEWKDLITLLIKDFIQFFLPKMYEAVDFSKKIIFLDKEFQKIIKEKHKPNGEGRSFKDKLVKVKLKSGEEEVDHFILIHIEVQSSYKKDFTKRMFKYFYRICDMLNWKTTAIAIYTGQEIPKDYNNFSYNFFGTQLTYVFNTYRVKAAKEEDLLTSDNPFALVVLASQYLNQSLKDYKKRLKFKLRLIELARERNYSELQIDALLTFIEYLLILPEDLEEQFEQKLEQEYLKTIDSMEATVQSKRLMTRLYNKVFGVSVEEIKQKAVEAEQKAVEARQKAIEARQKAVEARQKEEKAIIRLLSKGISPQEIAEAFDLSLEEIKKYIDK